MNCLLISFIMLFIPLAMFIMSKLISKFSFKDQNKISPFECGFDPKTLARSPFSLQFFLITIIFLIFDVEIALLLPIPFCSSMMVSPALISLTFLFLLLLFLGLYYEWTSGALTWATHWVGN